MALLETTLIINYQFHCHGKLKKMVETLLGTYRNHLCSFSPKNKPTFKTQYTFNSNHEAIEFGQKKQ